jgi:hypothetical protein
MGYMSYIHAWSCYDACYVHLGRYLPFQLIKKKAKNGEINFCSGPLYGQGHCPAVSRMVYR